MGTEKAGNILAYTTKVTLVASSHFINLVNIKSKGTKLQFKGTNSSDQVYGLLMTVHNNIQYA